MKQLILQRAFISQQEGISVKRQPTAYRKFVLHSEQGCVKGLTDTFTFLKFISKLTLVKDRSFAPT